MTGSMKTSPHDPSALGRSAAMRLRRVMIWLRVFRRPSSYQRAKAALTEIEAVHLSEPGQRLRREALMEKRGVERLAGGSRQSEK